MTFDVGDKVVYPHHGAATIEKREKKEAFGEKRDYLVLRLAYGDLTLMVPAGVGTATLAPRTASPIVIGSSMVKSLPERVSNGWGRMRGVM